MRTWTLAFSICAHAVAIGVLIVAPIFAAKDLPDPRRPLTFEAIVPITTPDVPVASRTQPSQATTTAPTIPLTPPTELPPDLPAPDPNPPADIIAPAGTGVPSGLLGPPGDPVIAPPPAPTRKDPVHVGGVIRAPNRVVYVQPIYPQIALPREKRAR
jgi:hypothetical protein